MNERNDLAQTDSNETVSTPLQPMSLVDILDGMFSLYRSHFRLFFGIAVVYLVFGFLINLISVSAAMGGRIKRSYYSGNPEFYGGCPTRLLDRVGDWLTQVRRYT